LAVKNARQKCVLIIIATGFEETEIVAIISAFRQAGLCVKGVGLTSGLVSGAHGVWMMPDLPLADLDHLQRDSSVSMVILSGGEQSLVRLEMDPRVYQLLGQVAAQGGLIAANIEGEHVLRAALAWKNDRGNVSSSYPIFLRSPGQTPEAFAQDLIRRLEQPPRR
jgi:putative intracellular protease/amidase